MNIGIVYYSRSGNTKKVAEFLEEKLKNKKAKVDLIEIQHVKKPGFFKAGRAAMSQKDMPIKNNDFNLKKYDKIIVGSPVWAGKPAPYIQSFFDKAEGIKDKKTGVFITGSASGEKNAKVSNLIKENLKSAGLKTIDKTLNLKVKKEEILEDKEKINDFVETVMK